MTKNVYSPYNMSKHKINSVAQRKTNGHGNNNNNWQNQNKFDENI